ncbi:hypothetical protein G9C98_006627 [Cotesia typhae]|uniref:SF4 helicase domain-containing protein n=1 Tax=Cotesia typhae TaxID=2053667 RepID=A0A8J5QPK0_9HYME|nr:hypothetical protein G9C98_006627 [Cotesia typhae]
MCQSCRHTGTWDNLIQFLDSKKPDEFKKLKDSLYIEDDFTDNWNAVQSNCQSFVKISEEDCTDILIKYNMPSVSKGQLEQLDCHYDKSSSTLYFPLIGVGNRVSGFKSLTADPVITETTVPQINARGLIIYKEKKMKNDNIAVIVPSIEDLLALIAEKSANVVICLPYNLQHMPLQILPLLESYKKLILWFGNDAASWDSARHYSKKLNEKRCFFVRPTNQQPRPKIAALEGYNLKNIIAEAQPIWHKSITTFNTLREDVLSDLQNIDKVQGIKWTRYPTLNRVLKGHRRGEFTVLTGPTGCGKTTFMSEYSLDLAMQGVNTLWGSFEIRNARLARTMLQQMAGVPLDENIQNFDTFADEFEKLPIYFMTFHGQQSIDVVMEAVEHATYVHDIAHVIIDNVQFMMGMSEQSKHVDRYWRQDMIVSQFRSFATKSNCHVTLVIHPRKELFNFFGLISNEVIKKPTILIGILVRNKAHTLPYFLSLLQNLEYPKDRISLWIRSDNNVDNSIEILNVWLSEQLSNYHLVNVVLDEKSTGIEDEEDIADWSSNRFTHVINLPKNKIVASPMLKSDGMYSNFWAGMTSEYYYKRTEQYTPILNRENPGCHEVPMIHSAVLTDLRRQSSDYLTYNSEKLENYDGPQDDIITFARSANLSSTPLYVCNDEVYGYVMVPLESQDTLEHDYQQLTNLKLEILSLQAELSLSQTMKNFIRYPKKDKLGLDHIYMINLRRRPERRVRMHRCFDELGIESETIDAVDGKQLNESVLLNSGVRMMPEYADPYHKRPMKMGEIGCFLSHFNIWNDVIDNNYDKVMVLEDDVRFEPFFRNKVNFILKELDRLKINWDLVYLGRKRMQERGEEYVDGSDYLVYAGYSYWTLGYILSGSGAKKLLEAKPLDSLVPVDEFLPILFDKHPRVNWKGHFPKRDLVALSAAPLIIYPTHYTGENGYISDTENSIIIAANQGTLKTEL